MQRKQPKTETRAPNIKNFNVIQRKQQKLALKKEPQLKTTTQRFKWANRSQRWGETAQIEARIMLHPNLQSTMQVKQKRLPWDYELFSEARTRLHHAFSILSLRIEWKRKKGKRKCFRKAFPKSVSKGENRTRKPLPECVLRRKRGMPKAALWQLYLYWRIAALRLNRKYVALETASFGWK